MLFENRDLTLNESDIAAAEESIGLVFPHPLRRFYLEHNGGEPNPYVVRAPMIHTVVSETLPLASSSGRRTALETYRALVLEKGLVQRSLLPFAVDAGGDYFFVDCADPRAPVFLYRADYFPGASERMEKIADSLDDFWLLLGPE